LETARPAAAVGDELGCRWTLIRQDREEHVIPAGLIQPFTWAVPRTQS
jgi:hypothetical protein